MPSENEKLRALLAEAREVAQEAREQAFSVPYAQWSREQHQADTVCFSIDAALAEPVSDCNCDCDYVRTLNVTVIRERDEARAEVALLSSWGPLKRLHTEMEAEVKAAYQRGAEAMREAAAEYIKNASHEDGLGMGSQRMESGIRALPLPEEKP